MRFMLLLVPAVAVGAAYHYVEQRIASGANPVLFPAAPVTLTAINPDSLKSEFTFDPREEQRWNGDRIANQTRLFNQHMEDIRNYANNPAGWHGAPPF
jgi:hypothetical protein